MKTFEAKYRGICACCDETIYPGDEVGYETDDLIHKDCAGSDMPHDISRRPRSTPDEVCPVCSLIHRGECL